jgi:hypothetical protein
VHNKVELAAVVFFCGRHTSLAGALKTWVPFLIFLGLVLVYKTQA